MSGQDKVDDDYFNFKKIAGNTHKLCIYLNITCNNFFFKYNLQPYLFQDKFCNQEETYYITDYSLILDLE